MKRVQDERSMENKMSSREFFSRFPSLHPFLLQELQQQSPEQYVLSIMYGGVYMYVSLLLQYLPYFTIAITAVSISIR